MNDSNAQKVNTAKNDKELRMRYYSSIREKGEFSQTFITPPPHWLNPNVFSINPEFDENTGEAKKNKSWVTILSVWNTMMGTGIISLPTSVGKAGIIPTILLNLIYFLVCFYTCQVIIKTGKKDNDYSDTVERFFGPKWGKVGRIAQIIFGLLLNSGAAFIFFLIINQNVYPVVAFVLNLMGFSVKADDYYPHLGQFSIFYCGIFIGLLMFPLLVTKQVSFLIKLNSYGIYFVSVSILFVICNGIYSLSNTSFDFEYKLNTNDAPVTEPRHLLLFGTNPLSMAGSLSLSYFSHTFALPMMKNNEKQQNNKRDLFLGYCLVFVTYLAISIMGYIGFSGRNYDALFPDNWFKFFAPDNGYIVILRLFSVFQLCLIFPIIAYIVRIQLFGTFYKDDYPSKTHITVFAVIKLIISMFILYFCYNMLSGLMGVIGAGAGLVLIYLIPLGVNIIYYGIKHPHMNKQKKLLDINGSESENTNNITKDEEFSHVLNFYYKPSKKPPNKLKDTLFYMSQYVLIILGILTLVFQFVPYNIFNVHIT